MSENQINIQPNHSSDHDLLIVAVTKLDALSEDVKNLSTGIYKRVDEMESEVKKNTKWINDFEVRWKLVVGMVGTLSIVITTVATLIVQYVFKLFTGG